jgi:competence CoiA-like predicted nuclease
MTVLRNPFVIREGSVILIEDLSKDERGLKCRCKCPECGGEFIARMGDVKEHHFAHSNPSQA